ncbi:Uncharacterized protein Fot_14314 [Forsythia ovata]|uniref:Uncharacterized protein n=1 Tax=Forsythia ovata TaxID=205694 RepID=A0ABD1W608_9LAMI
MAIHLLKLISRLGKVVNYVLVNTRVDIGARNANGWTALDVLLQSLETQETWKSSNVFRMEAFQELSTNHLLPSMQNFLKALQFHIYGIPKTMLQPISLKRTNIQTGWGRKRND